MAAPRIVALAALLATVALGSSLAGCAAAPAGGERSAADDDARSIQQSVKQAAASEAALSALVASDGPGCSAAVGRDGGLLWASARGLADPAAGTPLSTATRFEVASVSKSFTAALVLELARDGLLALDDPVATHVAGLPAWSRTVTLEQLVHHTARLPDFWIELEEQGIDFSDPADQQTVLAAIGQVEAPLEGTGYAYANSHYVLLAAVVEAVTGQRFGDALDERVLRPLGIDARVDPDSAGADVAVPHEVDDSPVRAAWAVVGPIGVVTTPSELVRWAAQFGPGGLLAEASARAVDDGEGERYGAGMRIRPDGTLYHAGRWGGSVSLLTVDPNTGVSVAVTCNQRGAPRIELGDALTAVWGAESRRAAAG